MASTSSSSRRRRTGRPSSFVECCGIALQLDRRQLKEGEQGERTTPCPAMGTNLSSFPELKISRNSTRKKLLSPSKPVFSVVWMWWLVSEMMG